MTPINFANKVFSWPRLHAKLPKWSPLWFLKIPSQVASRGAPPNAPFMFTLIQLGEGGHYKIFLYIRGLGECEKILKFFKITKSWVDGLVHLDVLLPDNAVCNTMEAQADFQLVQEFWKHELFLATQILLTLLITTIVTTTWVSFELLLSKFS